MSSDDGDNDRGWYDDLRGEWDQQPDYGSYNNQNVPEGWDNWQEHGLEGSHWHWETEHWATQEEALQHGYDMIDNPSEYIAGGHGDIAEWHVRYNEETDSWYLEVDAYIEY